MQTLNAKLEIKTLSKREFEGHGSTFGNVDLGGDVVMPGAFARTLAEHKEAGRMPQMYWMHDHSRVPGKWLEMEEDKKGLYVKGVLATTPLGDEILTLMKMDAVYGLSIGFRTRDAEFDGDVRKLTDIDLWEVSVVSLAMNPLAEVEMVKSRLSARGEYVPTAREYEDCLRGMNPNLRGIPPSQKTAKTMIARLKVDDGTRDVDPTRDVEVDEAEEVLKQLTELRDRAVTSALKDRFLHR